MAAPTVPMPSIVNGLSVDVEDWFQVGAFESVIARDTWERLPLRVSDNVLRVLDLFAEADAKATFFTLGWVARAQSRTYAPDRRCRARDCQPWLGPCPRPHSRSQKLRR